MVGFPLSLPHICPVLQAEGVSRPDDGTGLWTWSGSVKHVRTISLEEKQQEWLTFHKKKGFETNMDKHLLAAGLLREKATFDELKVH